MTKQFSDDLVKYMIDAYAAGENTKVIAGTLGVDAGTVTRRLRAAGVQLRPAGFQKGEAHHRWNGGRVDREDGYVLVLIRPDDPYFCMGQKKVEGHTYVLEHRLVMARKLGRPLTDDETVHHIDGNKEHNDIENLELRFGKHGKGIVLCCAACGSRNITAVPLGVAAPTLVS
jgi:hypothetical protein